MKLPSEEIGNSFAGRLKLNIDDGDRVAGSSSLEGGPEQGLVSLREARFAFLTVGLGGEEISRRPKSSNLFICVLSY